MKLGQASKMNINLQSFDYLKLINPVCGHAANYSC